MVKILIAGDYAPRARAQQLLEQGKFSDVFSDVVPYTSSVDYAILNLEAPVVDKTGVQGIDKCGPHLSCTSKAIEAMKYAGFNMATLANNHLNDYGAFGVMNTLDACRRENIDTVGADINLFEASKTFVKEINGKVFAIINCCEHEFSVATEDTPGTNPLNPIRQYRTITEAKETAAAAHKADIEAFASDNEILKQITDLALLANGMLKGKELSEFIARSAKVVEDAYLK